MPETVQRTQDQARPNWSKSQLEPWQGKAAPAWLFVDGGYQHAKGDKWEKCRKQQGPVCHGADEQWQPNDGGIGQQPDAQADEQGDEIPWPAHAPPDEPLEETLYAGPTVRHPGHDHRRKGWTHEGGQYKHNRQDDVR